MTAGWPDGGNGALGFKELEQTLQIKSGSSVAVINAPAESRLRLLVAGRADPDHADVVIGFAARSVDLAWLKPAYAAAHAGRLAWLSYPKPGLPGTDLRRDWLVRALRQYGIDAVQDVSIDATWSALQLRSANDGQRRPNLSIAGSDCGSPGGGVNGDADAGCASV